MTHNVHDQVTQRLHKHVLRMRDRQLPERHRMHKRMYDASTPEPDRRYWTRRMSKQHAKKTYCENTCPLGCGKAEKDNHVMLYCEKTAGDRMEIARQVAAAMIDTSGGRAPCRCNSMRRRSRAPISTTPSPLTGISST